MSRNRLFLNAKQGAGETGVILNHTFAWHGELLQYSFHLDGVPANSESLTVTKINPDDNDYNTLIRSFDLNASEIQDMICNDVFQFKLGEQIEFSFPNTSGVITGLQVVLKEAG